ncbi:hypothetical protein GUITHDRAFT_154618 [Guillardia theta CCMP2712]|uniref:Uncharacterized protein n=1 Tax=Guillardia theta (strain CCMP2712) TaxID=905079 RepID=L1ISF3_GUITC|nr:hypothetical protein GUITHDRAFT_154618 [Guillardia theta CCMP2712]EKX38755.1 hypothetical protein GUITHDRAFT_154618 [Guillardia theta CCMP2712]|eukprot:XP_005825735.1 hypothetical protein GUITHDRAFT_154618 [Guillardia theta CCMP2712]
MKKRLQELENQLDATMNNEVRLKASLHQKDNEIKRISMRLKEVERSLSEAEDKHAMIQGWLTDEMQIMSNKINRASDSLERKTRRMQQLTSDLEECSSAYVRTLTELSKSQSLSSRHSSPGRSPVDAAGEIGSIEHASQQDRLLQRSMNAREEIESIHEESKKNMETLRRAHADFRKKILKAMSSSPSSPLLAHAQDRSGSSDEQEAGWRGS